jgi:hypothetical protein
VDSQRLAVVEEAADLGMKRLHIGSSVPSSAPSDGTAAPAPPVFRFALTLAASARPREIIVRSRSCPPPRAHSLPLSSPDSRLFVEPARPPPALPRPPSLQLRRLRLSCFRLHRIQAMALPQRVTLPLAKLPRLNAARC